MAVFLLWLTIPLLVSEGHGLVQGVGLSVLVAAVYWSLNMGCIEAARKHVLPSWAPLLVAVLFFVIGYVHFYRRMAT